MRRIGRTLAVAASAVLAIVGLQVETLHAAGGLVISEFRLSGIDGDNDEYVEIYNDNDSPHTVSAISGSGYAIAASDGVVRCTIPNGTVIPARGHWLCVNSAAYALSDYPASSETYAVGDGTFTLNIPDNAGIAIFNNNTGGGAFILANRLDAVGSTAEANTLYKEGAGYPALANDNINYAWVRDECGKGGAINLLGACTISTPKDTDNNAVDFYFFDTTGSSVGAGQRLGVPGPQTLTSPIVRNSTISVTLLDATVSSASPPNRVRDVTSDPANHSTFGTMTIRRRFVNNTGVPVTRLRFRVIDLDTFPAAFGFADLRPRTSFAVVVGGINDTATCAATGSPATPPCTVTVSGTTHDQAISPNNPINGGGFNSSLAINAITLAAPLASGASVNLQFHLGIQQTGSFRFYLNIEALP